MRQVSPDGRWFWDGTGWRPVYSSDGRWQWDGSQWVPARPIAREWRYEPTAWTRWVQVIVLALMAIGTVFAVSSIQSVVQPMVWRSVDLQLRSQSAASGIDPEQLRNTMEATINASLAVGGVAGAVIAVIIVAGTIKLWAWVYWLLTVVYLLAILGILQDIVYALGQGPVSLPGWWLLLAIPLAMVQGVLGVWMILLHRRYGGAWAQRRVPL